MRMTERVGAQVPNWGVGVQSRIRHAGLTREVRDTALKSGNRGRILHGVC
jgi:hypothetical protein